MNFKRTVIALEGRLRKCRNVVTLGVRTNFDDYSRQERELICSAATVYYPSTFYADLFNAAGKNTFPELPHLQVRTGQDSADRPVRSAGHPAPAHAGVLREKAKGPIFLFNFPSSAIPRGSARGGRDLVLSAGDLETYCGCRASAYVQDYLPIDRDMRIVVIGKRIVHAYWRVAARGISGRTSRRVGRCASIPYPTRPGSLPCARRTPAAGMMSASTSAGPAEALRPGGQHEIRPGGLSPGRHRLCQPYGNDD